MRRGKLWTRLRKTWYQVRTQVLHSVKIIFLLTLLSEARRSKSDKLKRKRNFFQTSDRHRMDHKRHFSRENGQCVSTHSGALQVRLNNLEIFLFGNWECMSLYLNIKIRFGFGETTLTFPSGSVALFSSNEGCEICIWYYLFLVSTCTLFSRIDKNWSYCIKIQSMVYNWRTAVRIQSILVRNRGQWRGSSY